MHKHGRLLVQKQLLRRIKGADGKTCDGDESEQRAKEPQPYNHTGNFSEVFGDGGLMVQNISSVSDDSDDIKY